MTSRLKPATRPAAKRRRTHWENEERQQFWVTIGFIGLIVLALLVLAGAVAVNYYNEHLRPVARVGGTEISQDRWRQRIVVDLFRLTRAEGRVREGLAAGDLTEASAAARLEAIAGARQQVTTTALDDLVDQVVMAQLAPQHAVSVSDGEVETALRRDLGTPERRTVQAVIVEAASDPGAGAGTPEAGQAREAAEKALAELKAGKPFADVAKRYSTDPSGQTGGTFGTIERVNPVDRAWVDALFALPEGGMTGIVQGADGTFRIGRVAKILPAVEDRDPEASVRGRVDLAAYREAMRGEVLRGRLREKVLATLTTGDVEQAHVFEIFVHRTNSGDPTLATDGDARVAHILYSPKDDPSAAAQLDKKDPAWAATRRLADARAAALRAIRDVAAREKRFAEVARAESDDRGSAPQGGQLPYFTKGGGFAKPFVDAVFGGRHRKGDIIGPVQTEFGFHVILFQERDAPPDKRIADILRLVKAPGADFAKIARQHSDAPEAAKGGDLGWIARYEESKAFEDAVFALQPGGVSDKVERDDGYHVYRVAERAARPLTDAQRERIRAQGFEYWFAAQKEKQNIFRDEEAVTRGLTQQSPAPDAP